jgi:CRP-like cAMP-binding protein
VFFPTEGLVSMMVNLEDGTSMEIAMIGNEGMVGTSVLLEGPGSTSPGRRSLVQVAGQAYSLPVDRLMEEFERGGKLRHWLLRYIQALITQVAQIAVCNRHHEIEAQLCRWLLQRLDRLSCSDLYVTQKEIADLLGVRREGVTEAFGKLQEAGFIRCGRGHLEVLNRAGLEERVCECLAVIQKEYARLLGV